MNPPKINIAGHLSIGQHPVEMLRARFANVQATDAVKIPILDSDFPAPPCLIGFLGHDVFHDFLPSARGQLGIGGVEIHPRQAEADARPGTG